MTRSEWFTIIQDFIAKRIEDAPDEDCRALAEGMLEETTSRIDDLPDVNEDEELE